MNSNLGRLHAHEEALRIQSLAAIAASVPLTAHMQAMHDAMDHLQSLVRVQFEPGTDAHTVQLLSTRLFNVGGTTLKLALSGYYQAGFQLLRDAFELVNLVDFFRIDPTAVSRWRIADDKAQKEEFGPFKVRSALEAHPEFDGQKRDAIYKTYSNFASHPTYKSFNLLMSGGLAQAGPFFDEAKLKAVLEDLGTHLSHATLGVSLVLPDSDWAIFAAKNHFLDRLRAYHRQYIAH